MKIKRFVIKHHRRRLIAMLCCALGIFVWQHQKPAEPVPTTFLVQLQSEPEMIIGKRNLSEYDYGGVIYNCFNNSEIQAKRCEAAKDRARKFILAHWQNKKRAYIILKYGDVDFLGESYVFIEPNHNSQWEVVWKEDLGVSNIVWRGFGSHIAVKTARFINIKRAINKKDTWLHKLGTSYLVFLDKDGKEIGSF